MISSLYLMTSQTQAIQQAQSALSKAQTETATGQYADLGLQLGSQSGYELSLRSQNELLQTYSSSNSIVSSTLSVASSALDSIRTTAQTAMQNLIAWSSGSNSGASIQSLGASGLQGLISSANASSGGQYVLGGINSGVPPVADYFQSPTSSAKSALDQAFQTTFGMSPSDPAASSISATAIQSFLSGAFTAQFQGSNWSSNWSVASDSTTTVQIGPGETVQNPATANNCGLQQLAQAYAMLSEFGGSGLSPQAQQAVASTAASLISQGLSKVTASEANVGAAQAQVTDATDRLSAQQTLLQTTISGLDSVDPYQIATQIAALTTQIQSSYSVTARLQQMTLAQYLPVA